MGIGGRGEVFKGGKNCQFMDDLREKLNLIVIITEVLKYSTLSNLPQ